MDVTLVPCEGVIPRCALCHDNAPEQALVCPGCRTLVHAECREGVACPTLGCERGAPRTRLKSECGPSRTTLWSRLFALLFVPLLPRLATWTCLGGLFAFVFANLWGCMCCQNHTARVERTKADMRALGDALRLLKLDCGDYPRELSALWERPTDAVRWNGPYLAEPSPRDPWGNEYVYSYFSPTQWVVLSFGADGKPGGDDEDADLSSRTIDDRE
jgi:type II secretion system protein G